MRIAIRLTSCILGIGFLLQAFHACAQEPSEREVIGTVFGQSVYRDQISKSALQSKDWLAMNREMGRLFLMKPMQQFRKSIAEEIRPTQKEIDSADRYFRQKHSERMKEQEPSLRAQLEAIDKKLEASDLQPEDIEKLKIQRRATEMRLEPPPPSAAVFMLSGWKFQKHIYEKHGGGRTLWQQMGVEAFDATRRLIEEMEKKQQFRIDDPKLREELYKYWTSQDESPSLRTQDHEGGNGLDRPLWEPKE